MWSYAVDCHLALLDRVIRSASFLRHGAISCVLDHRRDVASLCMIYKIRANSEHSVNQWMPPPFVPGRLTRGAVAAHEQSVSLWRAKTSQIARTFVPRVSRLWNGLTSAVFDDVDLVRFKSRVNCFLLSN